MSRLRGAMGPLRPHRSWFEAAWNVVAVLTVLVGVSAASLWLGVMTAAAMFLSAVFVFWVWAVCLLEDVARWRDRLIEASLLLGFFVVTTVGLVAVTGFWGVPAAVAFVAVHPRVARILVSREERRRICAIAKAAARDSGNSQVDPATVVESDPKELATSFERPDVLGDAELRTIWSNTWAAMQSASIDEVDRYADYRRHCLEVLEQRYPVAFSEWLASGAANDTDPARILPDDFGVESQS